MNTRYEVHLAAPFWSQLSTKKQRLLKHILHPVRPGSQIRNDLEDLHNLATRNEEDIRSSPTLACFYCKTVWNRDDKNIEEWVDLGPDDEELCLEDRDSWTAMCPWCGIDSVIPCSLVNMTEELLHDMKEYWFGT